MADMMNAGAMPPAPEQMPAQAAPPAGMPPAQEPAQGGPSIANMFPIMDGPTPGQSLTTEPKSQQWERPPQFSTPEQATDHIWKMLTKPAVTKSTLTMLDQGIPVEALARTLLFQGFSEGKWTVDTMMLIGNPVMLMIATLGKAAGIEVKLPIKEQDPLDPIRKTYNQIAKNDYMSKPESGIDVLETGEEPTPPPMIVRKGKK